jgi:DNA-binding response OmpR family regulator
MEIELLKILVIGGDRRARRPVELAIEQAGFEVITANKDTQALRQLRKSQTHLVVLMDTPPAVNGIDLCFQVRQISQIPIIVISSMKDELTPIRYIEMGADAFIAEPVHLVELVARVHSLLHRALGLKYQPT